MVFLSGKSHLLKKERGLTIYPAPNSFLFLHLHRPDGRESNLETASIDACEAATFSMYIDSQMNCYPCSFGL
jgi:hypothetical protein